MAYIRDRKQELTGYQAGAEFRPSVDLACDFVMVYGIDDTCRRVSGSTGRGDISFI